MLSGSLHLLGLYFWMSYGPKFKIDLHRHYVAQNLQKCVMILIQVSEYKCNQNWGVKHAKNSLSQESQEWTKNPQESQEFS